MILDQALEAQPSSFISPFIAATIRAKRQVDRWLCPRSTQVSSGYPTYFRGSPPFGPPLVYLHPACSKVYTYTQPLAKAYTYTASRSHRISPPWPRCCVVARLGEMTRAGLHTSVTASLEEMAETRVWGAGLRGIGEGQASGRRQGRESGIHTELRLAPQRGEGTGRLTPSVPR